MTRYPLDLLPGWTAESVGYHTGDGKLYKGRPRGQPFGPRWSWFDIVKELIETYFLLQVSSRRPSWLWCEV